MGSLLLDLKRYVAARVAFHKAIELQPVYPGAYYNIAVSFRDEGNLEEAVKHYRKALDFEPKLARAHHDLQQALEVWKDPGEALAHYRKAKDLGPDFAKIRLDLGLALEKLGRREDAIAEYRHAIGIGTGEEDEYCRLADALRDAGKLDEAVAAYRKHIDLSPRCTKARNNLGRVLTDLGKPDEALAVLRAALEVDPVYVGARYNMGRALSTRGDVEGAIAEYRKAIELGSSAATRAEKRASDAGDAGGGAEPSGGRIDDDEMRSLVAQAHCNLGTALESQGKTREAVAEHYKAIELDPDLYEAHSCLGNVLLALGDPEGAEKHCRKAIALEPERFEAYANLGNALRILGKIEESISEHRKAVERQPNDPGVHWNLGHSLKAAGLFAEALEELRRGHELNEKHRTWRKPSDRWIKELERLVEIDGRLPAILAGTSKPSSTMERVELATLCHNKRLFAAAARFWREAFAEKPDLVDDTYAGHRYNAACSASLAGGGKGKDTKGLSKDARAGLRSEALAWLRAELSVLEKMLDGAPPEERRKVDAALAYWQGDADFAPIREPAALKKLRASERKGFEKLWGEVRELRERAGAEP